MRTLRTVRTHSRLCPSIRPEGADIAATPLAPEQIADRIAQAIRAGLIAPDAALVQDDLARRFGVSRNPVREALRLLQSQGLVTMSHGGGARVRALSAADLDELYGLRLLLEPTIAPGVVRSSLGRHVEHLRRLARDVRDSADLDGWIAANFAFHTALHELSELPRTTLLLHDLLGAVQPYARANVSVDAVRHEAESEHDAMIDAIVDGDADALGDILRMHVGAARARLTDSPDGTHPPTDPLDMFRPTNEGVLP